MFMRWLDLAFLHWPVPADTLRALLPPGLELDTHDGVAWLGVVPFRMESIRHRLLPPIPFASAFPELNVRTYVRHQGVPGVWFFSLDAAHRPAVRVARRTFHLPYFDARMTFAKDPDGTVHYRSTRTHRNAPPASFDASYALTSDTPLPAPPGSLDHFLTARYCLYSASPAGRIYRGHIHHEPWRLRPGTCTIRTNTMATPLGLDLQGPPLVHLASRLDVVAWSISPA
jgi:uncharacterized protein YqjF (DUF2071 family)